MGMIVVLLVATALSAAMGLTVTIPQRTYEVARGGNITLECNFVPSIDINHSTIVITWTMLPNNPDLEETVLATYYRTGSLDVLPEYENRISFKPDINARQANLFLSGITMAENKTFECSIRIEKDNKGQTSSKTQLIVLVAPSKPICKIQGTAEYFQNISLTCVSTEGSPPPSYKWQSYDVQNIKRNNPPKSTDVNGVLSLYNISTSTSGYYICDSTNKIGAASCNITLSVMPPSMSIGAVPIIIGAAAAGLLVLGIIIIYCCCCRKKKDKYVEGTPEEIEFHDEDHKTKGEYRDDDEKHADRTEAHQERSEMTRERSDDNDDQKDNYSDRQGKYDERSDRYDDRQDDYGRRDRYDDRSDRYDDRRDRNDDRRDNYDRRDRYDDRSDRYDDRQDNYDRRERYDDRSDRYDDRQDNYDRRDRYDDRRDNYDRRERYDDRSDRYNDRYDRYDDRNDRKYDRRNQYDDVYDDRHDRDDNRPPSVPPNKPKKLDDH